jgi:hypothetical protein
MIFCIAWNTQNFESQKINQLNFEIDLTDIKYGFKKANNYFVLCNQILKEFEFWLSTFLLIAQQVLLLNLVFFFPCHFSAKGEIF